MEYIETFFRQPYAYLVAVSCNLWLLRESVHRMKQLRWGFAGLVYVTVALWYFVDPVYREEGYQHMTTTELTDVYLQVLIFLVAFRFLLPSLTPSTPSSALRAFDPRALGNGRIATLLVIVWAVLFAIGVSRMRFDVVTALFPIKARAGWNWTGMLWARARYGGSTDFLISALGYFYEFVCSMFGLVAIGTKNRRVRRWMLFMMMLTWPSFILCGARHKILAVVMPSILGILVLKRWSRQQQILFLAACVFVINFLMLIMISYRSVGVDALFDTDASRAVRKEKHLGLNMTEELAFLNRYQANGSLPVEWGYNYFAHAVNFVPRGLWNNKPFPGKRFAELRVGFERGEVAATISNGLVGQGVANFGKWLGPIVPAFLMCLLCRWLCLFITRGDLFLRAGVGLVCLGSIPNLGRDIALTTIWPMIFGALAVILYESQKRSTYQSRRPMVTSVISNRRMH